MQTRRPKHLASAALSVVLLLLPCYCSAQYMYLDANGDGVNSILDALNPSGPTTLDVWLNTNHNRDGSVVTCPQGADEAMSIFSYQFILQANGGTITWGSYTNSLGTLTLSLGTGSSSTQYFTGFSGSSPLPPGLYKLGTLVVTIASGSPSIVFSTATTLDPGYVTAFGSTCIGSDFDNTLKFGFDWTNVDGIRTTGLQNFTNTPTFSCSFESYDVGAAPYGIAVGNINGDIWRDVVTTNRDANSVSVLTGDGGGTYHNLHSKVDYTTGSQPRGIVLLDLNGDGKTDIVTADYLANTVSVLLNNGDGTFATHVDYATGVNPWGICGGDFNGDGKLDIATADFGSNTVSVLLGTGTGTLNARTAYQTGSGPISLVATRLGPGSSDPLDLVVANSSSNTISVLKGVGDGTFDPKQDYAVGNQPYTVAAGIIANSPVPSDIVVANYVDHTVSVLLANGDGTLGSATAYACGGAPTSIAIGDLNGDNRRDLLVATYGGTLGQYSDSVTVMMGNGTGAFGSPTSIRAGHAPFAVAITDMNGDALNDLLVVNFSSNSVGLILNRGGGSFGGAPETYVGGWLQSIALGDLNRDGHLDAVTADYTGGSIHVLLGDGAGGMSAPSTYTAPSNPMKVAIADLNADGKPDVVVCGGNAVGVFLGDGNGGLGVRTDYPVGLEPRGLTITDLNQDGKPDIVTANYTGKSVSVLLGVGDGTFLSHNDTSMGVELTRVVAADFNSDGKQDVAALSSDSSRVTVLPGDGSGGFGAGLTTATSANPVGIAAADFNGDGVSDLALAAQDANGSIVSILVNSGTGLFPVRHDTPTGMGATGIAVGDLNGDGKLDVATADFGVMNTVSVHLGDGSGSLGSKRDFGAGVDPKAIAIAQMDGDAMPDLVVGNLKSVCVLKNMATITGVNASRAPSVGLLALAVRPNPFNPSTVVEFSLNHPGPVKIWIFDAQGRKLRKLMDGQGKLGRNAVRWDGTDGRGGRAASGIYFCKVVAEGTTAVSKMTLLR